MRKRLSLTVIILALLLAACTPSRIISTATPAINPPTASSTLPAPTFTPTLHPTNATSPTPILHPSITPEAPPKTQYLFGQRPSGKAGEYTIKPWNGNEAWQIIQARAPKFPPDENGQTYAEWNDWALVKLLLLHEIANRFPDSPHHAEAADLLISPKNYVDTYIPTGHSLEPFRVALEAILNADASLEISPETLKTILARLLHQEDILSDTDYPFTTIFPADNVLGNGAPGWIVALHVPGPYGAVFALAGRPGAYRMVTPLPDWRIFRWDDQQVFAYDLNANGIPEVAVWDSYWGSGMSHYCVERFGLYEWNGNNFVNLTSALESSANTDTGGCLDFEIVAGPNGTQAITTGNQINSGCSYGEYSGWGGVGSLTVKRRYEWNGAFFALAGEEILSLETSMPEGTLLNPCTLSWVNEAGAANDQAFQLLPTLLAESDPELTAGFADQFGPAYLDFFNFKLGTWYAMRGQQAQALALLTQVRNTPTHPEFEAASKLADAFLQDYPSTSAYAGCAAVNKVLDIYAYKVADPLYLDDTAMREEWGFSDWQWQNGGCATLFSGPSGREDPLNLCSLTTAFRLTVQAQNFTHTEDFIRWLDSQSIPYTGLEEGDIDGNGRRDWLVLLGTGEKQSWHLWALLNQDGGTLPVWISNIYRTTGNIPAVWNTFTPNTDSKPVNVYQWTDGMVVFRLVSRNDGMGVDILRESTGYYQGESFLGFTVRRPKNEGAAEELHVLLVGKESWQPDEYTLGWDSTANALRVISSHQLDQDRQVQAAESLLFEKGDPQGALEILKVLLAEETDLLDEASQEYGALPTVRPYLQYLLGLSYEMTGDERDAVVAYWTLWHDFPLHPLSYIVQQKLVATSP